MTEAATKGTCFLLAPIGAPRPEVCQRSEQARELVVQPAVEPVNGTYRAASPALEAEGWLSHTSNFLVALSPPLARRIDGQPIYIINRGDGDRLLNL